MLAGRDATSSLPQLHVNGRNIGPVEKIQEHEDFGELSKIFAGESPGKLKAEHAAQVVAEMEEYRRLNVDMAETSS